MSGDPFVNFPRESFRDHVNRLRWAQGEHLMICAGTGRGKSTLIRPLIEKRSHVIILVSKTRDATFERDYRNWERYTEWPKGGPKPWHKRILLWPKPGKSIPETLDIQREHFRSCIEHVNLEGNRCIVFDETLVLANPRYHGLGKEISWIHTNGRSNGISAVTSMQRPKWVPLEIMSNVSHAYLTGTKVRDDLGRLKDMASGDPKELGSVLINLPSKFDYAYVNPIGDARGAVINTRR